MDKYLADPQVLLLLATFMLVLTVVVGYVLADVWEKLKK